MYTTEDTLLDLKCDFDSLLSQLLDFGCEVGDNICRFLLQDSASQISAFRDSDHTPEKQDSIPEDARELEGILPGISS